MAVMTSNELDSFILHNIPYHGHHINISVILFSNAHVLSRKLDFLKILNLHVFVTADNLEYWSITVMFVGIK